MRSSDLSSIRWFFANSSKNSWKFVNILAYVRRLKMLQNKRIFRMIISFPFFRIFFSVRIRLKISQPFPSSLFWRRQLILNLPRALFKNWEHLEQQQQRLHFILIFELWNVFWRNWKIPKENLRNRCECDLVCLNTDVISKTKDCVNSWR